MSDSEDIMMEEDSFVDDESFSSNTYSDEENPPTTSKSKGTIKSSVTAKNSTSVLSERSTNASATAKSKQKTVEETYQKKSQLEHILLRPDTYSESFDQIKDPSTVISLTLSVLPFSSWFCRTSYTENVCP